MKRVQRVVLICLLMLLGGCASMQKPVPDPDFAPVNPPAPTPAEENNGAIYQSQTSRALFEDHRAHRAGDLLTIVLEEQTQASKSASTSTSKDQETDLGNITMFGQAAKVGSSGDLSAGFSGSRDFDGEGESSQSNQLSGNITVTVAEVLSNGNLVIRGEKLLTLNQGDEYLRIRGIVRQVDVEPDNTIPSTKIANAQITYGGRGVLAESNEMGWLARFFNTKWWPF